MLTKEVPSYNWRNTDKQRREDDDYDLIQIPKPLDKIVYKIRCTQRIKGRGKISVASDHSQHYLELVRKRFNGLR